MAHVEALGAELRDIRRFIAAWTDGDRYDRFGTTSESAAEWLIDELATPAHRGLLAYAAREIVALLDFVHVGYVVEFGIFVILVAYCHFQNHPAMAFLSRCNFSLEDARIGECRCWRYRR